ncbi:response regulator transcription factor [Clostridium celatum]|uniref:Stage 0 sporulation protein A homolog n=1 Tax=Clostridium celatum DSM 1785 TaxID=545697 RepID=L1QPA9_9CLOT|nr:response regulator transcription factor [Clostridium celatum]EKY29808.1 putative alkaline phosphatase synthesis transcriptional regulatory protein PhoP [Clostridium celatum DSM 1785]MCE9656401.1 response regulator transcription factor [Clostridium celatum]MDU2265517.1 response regulator transcription factor [Clostridium celatum]MDU3721880.1 response regulator transcription factor [Clostridium celatum]MDU6295329.1 response regulator transcription factor [Clostridium celatum]
MDKRILIAEDDEDIIGLLKLYLEKDGYEVVVATNGEEAFQKAMKNKISLAILDIMMPKMNGYELTKRLREVTQIPILILSAKNDDSEKILGLDLGADDYLTKPFNPLEVLARIRSLLRRSYEFNAESMEQEGKVITIGEITLDESARTISKNGVEIPCTPTEYKMLALFMKKPGRVFTKAQIYECINGEYYQSDDNSLMVHIYRIREKIEEDSKNPTYIKTVRGLGYKFEKM